MSVFLMIHISGNIAFGQKEYNVNRINKNAAKVSNSIEFIEKLDKSLILKLVKMA